MGRLTHLAPRIGKVAPLIGRAPRNDQTANQYRDQGAPWRKWYKTQRWRKLREKILLRDLFTCQMPGCGKLEGNTSLLVCDHIKAHRGDERLFFDQQNLHCICKPCHDNEKQKQEQASLHHRGIWD